MCDASACVQCERICAMQAHVSSSFRRKDMHVCQLCLAASLCRPVSCSVCGRACLLLCRQLWARVLMWASKAVRGCVSVHAGACSGRSVCGRLCKAFLRWRSLHATRSVHSHGTQSVHSHGTQSVHSHGTWKCAFSRYMEVCILTVHEVCILTLHGMPRCMMTH